MPLQVLPASEADAARVVALEQVAFRDDPLAPYLFPGPFPTEGDTRAETLIKQLQEESRCKWVKVVDTDLAGKGEEPMVAFSQWYVWDPPRLRGQNPSDHWGAGTNPEACELFFGGMLKMQDARFDGIPFLYLKLLATDPEHQRRGAGSMLLKWGIEESERRGIPAYLEASEKGRPLYEKFGFKCVDYLVLDFSKWGGQVYSTAILLREPTVAAK